MALSKHALSIRGPRETANEYPAPAVTPLQFRFCIALLFLASALCYGLGFAVFALFQHLLAILWP